MLDIFTVLIKNWSLYFVFMFCFSLLKLSFYILCLSFKFYKYIYGEMFLIPDYSWVMNSTNPTSLALPFTLFPHSIYFVLKKFARKHWAHEHDCFHTSSPLSFSLSSKPVSVSLSILIFSFLSPRNWSISQVCMLLGFPAHSAIFQSRCL